MCIVTSVSFPTVSLLSSLKFTPSSSSKDYGSGQTIFPKCMTSGEDFCYSFQLIGRGKELAEPEQNNGSRKSQM